MKIRNVCTIGQNYMKYTLYVVKMFQDGQIVFSVRKSKFINFLLNNIHIIDCLKDIAYL